MTEEEARMAIEDMYQQPYPHNAEWVGDITGDMFGRPFIKIEGHFTAEALEGLAWWLRNKPGERLPPASSSLLCPKCRSAFFGTVDATLPLDQWQYECHERTCRYVGAAKEWSIRTA